jgi:peroxiredoxin Q/BCP
MRRNFSLLIICGLTACSLFKPLDQRLVSEDERVRINAIKKMFQSKIGVGDEAPDFELPSQLGTMVRLSQFRGRWVVLYFYPKDDTYGCIAESCSFRDNYQVFKDRGAEVLGVSSDSPDSHVQFAQKYRLPFTLLSDQDSRVRQLYGVPTTMGMIPGRVTYVIDKQGVVQHVFNSQFSPKSHVDQALAAIN